MRITLGGLTTERARDIYDWLHHPAARFFFEQLDLSEVIATQRLISDQTIDLVELARITEAIKTLRAVQEYKAYLKDFLSERVTEEKDKIIS